MSGYYYNEASCPVLTPGLHPHVPDRYWGISDRPGYSSAPCRYCKKMIYRYQPTAAQPDDPNGFTIGYRIEEDPV